MLSLIKKLKFSPSRLLSAFTVFLLLICFAVSARDSFPASNAAKSGQSESYKKMDQIKRKEVAPGDWGGTGINLTVEKESAAIVFDCAEARITEKLMVDKKGNFIAGGNYLRRSPGAIRLNSPLKSQPAKFEGKISGTQMSLKITLTATKEIVGNYVLHRDKSASIRRCL